MATREECIRAAGRQYAIALTDPVESAAIRAGIERRAREAATPQTSCPPAPGVRADKTPTTHQRRTA